MAYSCYIEGEESPHVISPVTYRGLGIGSRPAWHTERLELLAQQNVPRRVKRDATPAVLAAAAALVLWRAGRWWRPRFAVNGPPLLVGGRVGEEVEDAHLQYDHNYKAQVRDGARRGQL